MVKTVRSFFLSFTIVVFVLFSTIGTTTAYADDGTGTETPVTDPTTNPAEGQASDPVVEVTPAPTEPVPTEEVQPTATPLPAEETVIVDPAPENILEQVPENTTVVVLNSEGDALPLASQESADAIASAYDPIWCPAGQAPTPGLNGCTASFSSFDELLTFLQANEIDVAYQTAGTIYIQQGEYLGGESQIDFNNYTFNEINKYDLTLQGGWDTNTGTTTATTQFNVPIIIGSSSNPWTGSLTLNNLSISDVTGQAGLTLFTQGDIALSNIEVTNSQSGADLTAGGDVTVTDSNFDSNTNAGATIKAGDVVNITNSKFNNNGSGLGINNNNAASLFNDVNLIQVTANNNQSFGANIESDDEVMIHDSFFNGNKSYTFSSTGKKLYDGYGLRVVTIDNVDLKRIEATYNNLYGAHIETSEVAIDTANFSNNSSGDALNLTGRGLEIVSDLDVMLVDVNANNNQLFGADIRAGDSVSITARKSKITGIQNKDNFNGHVGGYGLRVVANLKNLVSGGLIAVENVNANNNSLYGAYLQGNNTAVQFSSLSDNGSEIVTATTGFGLQVVSTGTVALNTVDASRNKLFGADIAAANYVTVTHSFFSEHHSEIFVSSNGSTNYYGYGLNVVSKDAKNIFHDIILDDVVGNYNNLWGGSLTGGYVSVSNSQFNNNVTDSIIFIDDTGLLVNASGNVDIYNTEAKENRLIGATITAAGDVTITESNFSDNRGITCIYICNEDLIVYGYGLNVFTSGNILVSNTTANNNFLFGATLNGANVEVINSTFDFNGSCIVRPTQNLIVNCINRHPTGQGLNVISSGNTSLINVTASNNERFGANLQTVGNVTIIASVFSGNKSYTYYDTGIIDIHGIGLSVTANGDILLNTDANGVGNAASDNGGNGAILIGQSIITVTNSIFNNNVGNSGYNNGLSITQLGGDVTLNNVTASNNSNQDGVNVTGACGKIVYVNGGNFSNNDRYGLKIKLSTLVLDGTQTFANNIVGNVYTSSKTCPPVVVPPVVVPPVVVPPVVVPPVVVAPVVVAPVVIPPVIVPPVDNTNNNDASDTNNATTNNSNPSNTTISNSTNSNATTLNNSSDRENKKGHKGDKIFKFGKHGVGKIKMRGNHHFKRPCLLKVIPI